MPARFVSDCPFWAMFANRQSPGAMTFGWQLPAR